jgi:hypothetical protein
MTAALYGWLMQVDPDYFRRVGEEIRSIREGGAALGLVVLSLALVFGVIWYVARRRTSVARGGLDDPEALLQDLVRLHRLDRGEAQVVQDVAAAQRLADPGVLFVRPNLFDRCFTIYLGEIGDADLRRRAEEEVARLRQRLFGKRCQEPFHEKVPDTFS